ncbi:MAG: sensor histidine kinase [Clostridium sp.]|uniref:sensor histidine kinase n=1 Tax=Clostridium sp. TaxID=1506 RepID=UPI003EE4CBDD
MRRKIEVKRYLYIGCVAITIQTLFYLTGYLNKNYSVYVDLTYIYCGTIAIGLSIISMLRKNDSFYKYLGISFMGIGLLEYFKIITKVLIESEHVYYTVNLVISVCIGNFEVIVVLLAIVLWVKGVTNIQVAMINIIALIINSIYIFLLMYLKVPIKIYLVVGGSLLIICYKLLKKNNIKDFKIISYMIILFVIAILKIVFLGSRYQYIFLVNTLRMLAYFLIYEGISEKVYSLEFVELEEKVKKNKKETKVISNRIKTRKTILEELSKMKKREETYHYNIIDGFSEGIIIDGDAIKYANKKAMELLKLKSSNIFDTNELCNKILVKTKNGERAKLNVNGEEINVEIHKSKIEDDIKIFYIKKINDILKYEKVIREYESYIRKENVKNEFYTNISHELRTPINIVSSALEVNEIKLEKRNLEGISSNNTLIKKNCLRLIRTINNFIDANKISEGYLTLNKKRYNIVEVVEEVVQASARYIKERDMEIVFDVSDEEIIARVDRELIERAILNLLSNSVKYREKKGERIDVEVVKYTDSVYILVSNNGIRIDKLEEKNIFEKFKKLDNGLNRENEGSGLGLYLCREIIEAHKGEIKLHSDNYIRNEFIIKLGLDGSDGPIDINRNINSLEEKVEIEFSDIN